MPSDGLLISEILDGQTGNILIKSRSQLYECPTSCYRLSEEIFTYNCLQLQFDIYRCLFVTFEGIGRV